MIIPIGHESQKVHRIPWISFIIMAACFIIHISVTAAMQKVEKDLQIELFSLIQYYFSHTYLELNPDIKTLFNMTDEDIEALEKQSELLGVKKEIPGDDVIEEEQQELDRLSRKALDTIENIPYRKYGFIPKKKSLLTLFTYMFLHGGWLHLIGNLLLFYLSGPFIEDIWGKPAFLALYVIGGMLAGQMFAMYYPDFAGPLIGASGAVSAVMGAFLVKFWRVKIKFFFWIFIIAGTFRAPAWAMLPLWVFLEFYNAKAMDSLKLPGGGGVAHWAHIWGFVFGVAIALGLKYSGIEDKYISPKIKAKVSFVDERFTIYEDAMRLADNGKKIEAFNKLLEGARQHPTNQEIVEFLWHLGLELDKKKETASYYLKLVESELRRNNFELGLFHYGQLKEQFPDISLSDQTRLILSDYFISHEDFKAAEQLIDELTGKMNLSSPAGFLLQLYDTAGRLEFSQIGKKNATSHVNKIIELSLQHPDIPEFKKIELKTSLNKSLANLQPEKTGSGRTGFREENVQIKAVTEKKVQKKINITRVVPLGFKESKIILDIENVGHRVFSLDKIHAIAVVKISSQNCKPLFLIDLFADNPVTAGEYIRTIRMFTPQIQLQQLFPEAQDRLDAFRKFIALIFKLSGARPYPDPESVQLKKVRVFTSIAEYDNSLK